MFWLRVKNVCIFVPFTSIPRIFFWCTSTGKENQKSEKKFSVFGASTLNISLSAGHDSKTLPEECSRHSITVGVFLHECICRSHWSSLATVCTFTAVHRGESFSSVDGPAHLCGNPKVSHYTCVQPIPAGQDHLGKGDRHKAHKAYLNMSERATGFPLQNKTIPLCVLATE